MRSGLTSAVLTSFVCLAASSTAAATDLQPRTVAAFDRYVRLTEARMKSGTFLLVDAAPDAAHRLKTLRSGENLIDRLTTREGGREIDVPNGMIHHWVGAAFAPGVSIEQTLALLQDYDAFAAVYKPNIARSKLLARDGDRFTVFLRFVMKKVITVVVNSEHVAQFSRPARDRAEGRIYSTRIAEVEDPDTPMERERPVGRDGGYLWRLNTYWRLLARDGGTYIECESVSLTRSIPTGFGWLVGPFVTSIPRDSLTFTMQQTRQALTRPAL